MTMEAELSSEQCELLRTKLMQQRKELLVKAREGLELSMNRDRDRGGDSIDDSNEEELISTELRLRDREKKLLSKIREAMDRLDESTINQCEDCDGPIGFKRLLVRPVTTLCISCKELREAHEVASEGPLGKRGGTGLVASEDMAVDEYSSEFSELD
jgi:DnaK suppressor protein